jgi:hypothetical protein
MIGNPGPPRTAGLQVSVPCVQANARWLNPAGLPSPTDAMAVYPVLNEGRYIFNHTNPDNSYRNLGGLVGVDMPIIEVKSE